MGSLDYDEELLNTLRRVYGDLLDSFLKALSEPGPRYYIRVNTLKIQPGELLDMLREKGLDVRNDEYLEEALYFPVSGPHRIPVEEKMIVADKRAAESVMLGANLYAPGVLRADKSVRKGDMVTIVDETGRPVAYGEALMGWDELGRTRRGIAVRVVESLYKAPQTRELPEFKEGFFYEQSLPAMLATKILEPKPGETVVDMCAAPGGKATHAAQLTGNKARILAFDHSKRKIEVMRAEARRLGARIEIRRADSRYLDVDYPGLRVDRVILDPPCTALGVRPKLWDRKRYRDVLNSSAYQRQFIKVAYRLLKPGGLMVYSTCTVTFEENEENIAFAESLGLRLVEPPIRVGSTGLIHPRRDAMIRFHPHLHPGPGYFIALMAKP